MSFCHLHVHTEHSFLDGVPTLPGLVNRVTELGQTAVAITDHGEVSGHLKFQKAAHDGGITPVFGMEGYFVDDVYTKIRNDYDHITLLAVSQVGLTNLWKLSSRAYSVGMYYKPRIDWKMLEEFGEGIVATGGCLGGCVSHYLIEGEDQYDPGKADERIGRFMDILEDRFYLELHTLPDDKQRKVNVELAQKAADLGGVPLIAVSDSHYLKAEDWEMHELLIAAQMKKKSNDPSRYTYGYKPEEAKDGKNGYGALHVLSEDEVTERLTGHLDPAVVRKAMDNTVRIAESAEGIQIEGNRTYPVFLDTADNDVDALNRDAWMLFDDRIGRLQFDGEKIELYRERLRRELDLVIAKGYAGYFLITADLVRWAKNNGILVGPGRGSAGGSLLSYVLGIIEIDPVANGLLFERFLDPNLKSLPDIDIDVPQLERQAVLEYLRQKYQVSGIGTLNTLKPRLLLKDFCRVLTISHSDEDLMGRIITSTPDLDKDNLTWQQVYDYNVEAFAKWKHKHPKLFNLMFMFAAHYRHAGAHAGGVVVSRSSLFGSLPLRVKDKTTTTQIPMEDVEELGYMKMDFLGIRTLSTLMRSWWMATGGDESLLPKWDDRRGDWFDGKDHFYNYVEDFRYLAEEGNGNVAHFYDWQYNAEKYYDDQDVYKSLWDGRNLGVFQIETEGVSEVTKRYLPQSLEDMCAIVSLYRPGVTRAIDPDTKLNLLEQALQKREGRLRVIYRHPLLEPILKSTYGVFLYQEQIMQVVRDIGSFSPEDQTKVRKSIGKKLGLETFKDRFIEQAVTKGMKEFDAAMIWNDMERFGEYGFNKSHGFAYGMIAYWTAWMKHYYPEEFMCALFQTNDKDKKVYNRECRRLNIPLLGPDVNESKADYALVNGRIRYGFQGTLNLGKYVSVVLQKHRPYSSATEVMNLLEGTRVNKGTIESLILVGALDSVVTDEDREGLPPGWSVTKVALYRLFRRKLKIGVRKDAGLDEHGIFQKYLPEFQEYAESVKVDDRDFNEPKYLGEHVTTLPFGRYLDSIQQHYRFPGYDRMIPGEKAVIGGNIGEILPLKVKKLGPNHGKAMAWVWLEFPVIEEGVVVDIEARRLVCFPKEYTYLSYNLEEGVPIIAKVEKLADKDGYEGGLSLQSVYRMDRNEYPGQYAERTRVYASGDKTAEKGYWD